ncbi:MAG: glucose-1-phosphate thymidylyltransferase [Candidatus Kerfeldbacteria bacterium]|nr:glucose-1-phosphate thymidylyltransferase [Candidatus Kerfeldbacteria bacterium]
MKALIAAGGRGTRLRPITYSMNKHLIPVANIPLIVWAIQKVVEAGITDIAININEGDTELPKAIGDGSTWNVKITYIEQVGGALGVAHVIKNAKNWLGKDSFVFYLGDNIVLGSINPFVAAFQEQHANAFLALTVVPDPERFGVPQINSAGEIERVIEKPSNPPSQFAVTGIYCFDQTVHDAIDTLHASNRGELEISDTITAVIAQGGKVKYQIVEGWWKDTGKPYDLLEGNRLLLESMSDDRAQAKMIEDGVDIQGKVQLGNGAQLLGKTIIRGPVSIGKNAIIADSYIGPYTSIGHGTEIDGGEIENSIIMDDTDIQCSTRIVDSIIGHNVTIQNAHMTKPSGHKLMIGENSSIEL